MKKITVLFAGIFLCLAALGAENIKFKVGGSAKRYNQIRVVNNTHASYFDCEAFLLEERDGKLIAQESMGSVRLEKSFKRLLCWRARAGLEKFFA